MKKILVTGCTVFVSKYIMLGITTRNFWRVVILNAEYFEKFFHNLMLKDMNKIRRMGSKKI